MEQIKSSCRNVGAVFEKRMHLSSKNTVNCYDISLNRDMFKKFTPFAINGKLTVHIAKTSEKIIAKTPETPKFYAYIDLDPTAFNPFDILQVDFDVKSFEKTPIHMSSSPGALYKQNLTLVCLLPVSRDSISNDQDWVCFSVKKIYVKSEYNNLTLSQRKKNKIFLGTGTSTFSNLRFEEFACSADCTLETLQKNIDMGNDHKVLAMITKNHEALKVAESGKLTIPSNSLLCKMFENKDIPYVKVKERAVKSEKSVVEQTVESENKKVEFKKELKVAQKVKRTKKIKH